MERTEEWKQTWGNPDWKPELNARVTIHGYIGHLIRTYWGTVTRHTPKQFEVTLCYSTHLNDEGDGTYHRTIVQPDWEKDWKSNTVFKVKFIRSGGFDCWCASARGDFYEMEFYKGGETAEHMCYY